MAGWERLRRCLRTVFFMLAMLASLLVQCLPLLVAIGDVLVPCVLVSSFTCVRCYGFKQHLRRYAFKSSLVDIPLVSVFRSLLITCVYSLSDAPALSHGPYLGSVTICSISSILLLSVKACVFSVNSQMEAEASLSISRRILHLKKAWGMPVLFLSSVVFALGHMVIAYRISCKARRKLLFHRVDPETVLSCKSLLSAYQKLPRSPIPSSAKVTPKSDSETRRKPYGLTRYEGVLPVRLLADIDSLFTTCEGFTIHYKISMPSSPTRSLSSTTFVEPSRSCSPQLGIGVEANGECGIVLVHGFGGGVFSWRHVMGTLARQVGRTVAAFDRPGWGLTPRLLRKDWEEKQLPNPYRLDTQVDLLLSFCSEMGFSSVIFVGHDDGGLLALRAAERVKTSGSSTNISVKAIVLLSADLSRDVVPSFARILLRTSLGKKHLVQPLLRTEITQVVNRRAWYDATKLTTEVLNLYKAPLCVEGWDEALHEIGKLSGETVLSPEKAASLVKAVQDLPILVVTGAEDALVALRPAQTMASKFVDSRLVAISGCGHLPHEECPKALLAAVSPFISRVLSDFEVQIHTE
ncbi:uncharacterized protein [Spinacia oleracea]|uniref:Uncharacterized protein isoform X2 n=1 Tax=Spinacia oleracea TaxID=3562 RepID=A0ABM3RT94_SPIOL|nr:uncharacterized protein LOC110787884 isoform X2 [Spinacia oleracea]